MALLIGQHWEVTGKGMKERGDDMQGPQVGLEPWAANTRTQPLCMEHLSTVQYT